MISRKYIYAALLLSSLGFLFFLQGGTPKGSTKAGADIFDVLANKNRIEALERKTTEVARYCRVPDSVYGTPTGYGQISKITGRRRTKIVRGHYRGSTWINSYARS